MRPAILLLLSLSLAAAVRIEVSTKAPVKNAPQLLLFTHDDDVSRESAKLVLGLTDSVKNPNGCNMPATWYACTGSCPFDCGTAKRLFLKGHELASHTVHHPSLRSMSKQQIKKEVGGARDALVRCGIPKAAVQGFRCPYLEDSPAVRQALFELGFRYDSTIGARGGANRPWPATMEGGVPYDCSEAGQSCSGDESYPGMFEVPLYATSDNNLMDYCTNESNGEPRAGCSAFSVLKKQFDAGYRAGRAPMQVLIHTPYLKKRQYYSDLKRFLAYAMSHKDVWAVTTSQLLDWMEAPVPAAQMPRFMAKYTCPK